jgi:DNA (cytosine-5)-methyltransferase 1
MHSREDDVTERIPNHYSAKLSDLDLETAYAVPPGGNWKSIPDTIPLKRLTTIRESFGRGEGSRSTYYGRLHPDAPSYTINTYFGRPGNGCHLHYDYSGGQHRVISEREAARLQSFPDSFTFVGSHASVAKQIGNAVPPLLAFQIARAFGEAGRIVDLFCGAGGLALGFSWAGWEPVTANDIDRNALKTYVRNVHGDVVEGSIRDLKVYDEIRSRVGKGKDPRPLLVVGGPPCQGFSTAGKPRSMEDERNTLFYRYRDMLADLRPDAFLFENVTGLLNMEGGRVFEAVKKTLSLKGYRLAVWKLRAEEFGVPQRRTRVFVVGCRRDVIQPPEETTQFSRSMSLFGSLPRAISVREALDDLPPLQSGEDGSSRDYRSAPTNSYQSFMRGQIGPEAFLATLASRQGVQPEVKFA